MRALSIYLTSTSNGNGNGCLRRAATSSSPIALQAALYTGGRHHCPKPCGATAAELGCQPTAAQSDAAGVCFTAQAGDQCSAAVDWGLRTGLLEHPAWYKGAGTHGKLEPKIWMQAWLYAKGPGKSDGCRRPCGDLSSLSFQLPPSGAKGGGPPDPNPAGRCNERTLWEPEKFTEAVSSYRLRVVRSCSVVQELQLLTAE